MVELVSTSATELKKSFAGDTYNTAVYLKRNAPGLSVSYLTAIGEDFLSNELLFAMGDEQINTGPIIFVLTIALFVLGYKRMKEE